MSEIDRRLTEIRDDPLIPEEDKRAIVTLFSQMQERFQRQGVPDDQIMDHITDWIKNEADCRGIFNMATPSGKLP